MRTDGFVAKLSPMGDLIWVRQIVGLSGHARGFNLTVDDTGGTYAVGFFASTVDFDPGLEVFSLTSSNDLDGFVLHLDADGNFVWAGQLGGIARNVVYQGGAVYVAGSLVNTADLDPGSGVINLTSAGRTDFFVLKIQNRSAIEGPPLISEGGIVLATLLPKVETISPLSIISVFGQNFSDETILYPNLDGEGKIATILGETCLMMNGEALPIFAVTPTQINAQASATKMFGPASFTVVANCATTEAVSSAPLTVESDRAASPPLQALASSVEMATVEEATPGFFLFPPLAENGFIAARFNSGNAAVAPDGMFTDQFGPSRPAKPGDIIVLYGTGWGETEAELGTGELAVGAAELLPGANPMVSFGGIPLAPEDVLYVGVTPQAAGLYQLAIRVPEIALAGDNQVILTVYGKSSPAGPVIPVGAP